MHHSSKHRSNATTYPVLIWLTLSTLSLVACSSDRDGVPLVVPDAESGQQPQPISDAAPTIDASEELAGGESGTVFDTGRNAYSHALPQLTSDQERAFFRGRALFRDGWVAAPSSTRTRDGLGPLFNARSCVACHVGDGRGRPPIGDEPLLSLLFRLSVPGTTANGAPQAEPAYGGQLQPFALSDIAADGDVIIEYEELPGMYGDGETYSLRRPIYTLNKLAYGPTDEGIQLSPRVAPAMHGLGLLEAIPETAIVALTDENDADGDGISGRANYVWDQENQKETLGRFGWKANQPSLLQQTAGAFNGDLGITSRIFPDDDCTPAQTACAESANGGEPELIDPFLEDVTFYARTLAVPARRDLNAPAIKNGTKLFSDYGCTACHVPSFRTGDSDIPALSDQLIYPYTDLLLHDMGSALADNRPDFRANGTEWRTPPLWGIGLLEIVNGHKFLLHDGRARGLAEAILWHGGEAEQSRERFRLAPATDRAHLIAFLESL